jgi:hypothetical protein
MGLYPLHPGKARGQTPAPTPFHQRAGRLESLRYSQLATPRFGATALFGAEHRVSDSPDLLPITGICGKHAKLALRRFPSGFWP